MANLFGSGTNKKVTGKAADSGYDETKTTTPKPQVQLPNLQNLFQSNTSGTDRQVTGKAADSGYTAGKKQASQAANRQVVQNWWNNEQVKSAQDNSTNRAYTAKLTGGANIDNSTEVVKSLQRTFGGANDSAETQYNRTLKSKMGYGRNCGNPRSTVGNAIESGVAGTVADWLNAAGTALKSDRRSGLAVDSGDVEAKATGKEWYNRAGNHLQKEADWARMLSQNAHLRGSRDLNNAQKLLFDAGIAGTQMASDVALGTLTGGSATIPLAIRSFGSGAQQARQAGATENQQMLYGTANALKEAFTEKLFDGLAGIHGKGTADDFVDTIAKSFAKSDGGQALARGLLNMGGEGLEEVAGGFVDPALQGIYNGKTFGENYRELNMAGLMHDGAVGMLLGGLVGSVNIAQSGSGQISSYADALRKVLSEQNETALDTNADSFNARYQELERKYLDGSISPDEGEELWELEHMKGQFDKPSERMDGTWETGEDPYAKWNQWENSNAAAKDEIDYLAAKFFGVSGIKNLSPIIKRSTIKTQGGFECFPDGDILKQSVQNIKPLDTYFDVAMHGTSAAVCFGSNSPNMNARILASIIRHSEGYTGQNIRLLSCSTGKSEGPFLCFAEELANALGVTVQAPNLDLYISENGTFQVGEYGEGAFVEYKPNERRRLK